MECKHVFQRPRKARPVYESMAFADRLRFILKARGMSQVALAKAVGVESQAVSQWVSRVQPVMPVGARLLKIAQALKVSLPSLMDADEAPIEDMDEDDPVNQTNAEVLAAYAAISEEGRKAIMDMMKAMAPKHTGELPPVRINRLMGHVPLDELDIGALEQELDALLLALRKRQAELNRPPPRPFQGGSGTENSVEDCRRVVTIPRETRKIG
jgi:transcriptional regulator with XRE-family HTH domain